jgi:hypothetical protein
MPWLSEPDGSPENHEDLQVHFFDDEAERALRLLVAATAILDPDVLPPEPEASLEPEAAHEEIVTDPGAAAPDEILDEDEDEDVDEEAVREALQRLQILDELTTSRTELSRLLIRRALAGEDRIPTDTLRAPCERLDAAIDAVRELLSVDREMAVESVGTTALEEIAQRLRELGLEEADVSLHLVRDRDGSNGLAWHRIPPATAHVWLLGSLYDRVERSVEIDALLDLERRASRWWFLCLSAERRGEDYLFSQGVREQEWSLVDRPTLVTEVPVMSAFCEQPFFPFLPARQQALARALRRSFVGVFTVRAPRGETQIFESLLDGRRYEVHEHNPQETRYSAGALALGRLIPWEDGLHLRSPGMVIVPQPNPGMAPTIAEALGRIGDAMPAAAALEGAISAIVMGSKVPRKVRPAASRTEARELLDQLPELFEEYDLIEEPDLEDEEDEIPEEIRQIARQREVERTTYRVDAVMADWIRELNKLANTPAPSGAAGGSKKRKRGKQKRKKRR